eukprot:8786178-Pyramimonas_sp.AAC.1
MADFCGSGRYGKEGPTRKEAGRAKGGRGQHASRKCFSAQGLLVFGALIVIFTFASVGSLYGSTACLLPP